MSALGKREKQVEQEQQQAEDRCRLVKERIKIKTARDEGFAKLKAGGITVLLTQKQLDNETIEQAKMWTKPALLTLLRKGTDYRFIPPPLLPYETIKNTNRAATKLVTTVRQQNRIQHLGKQQPDEQITNWEKSYGLKPNTWKKQKLILSDMTLEQWQERLDEELSRGISIKVTDNLKLRYKTLGNIPEFAEAIRDWVAQMNEIEPPYLAGTASTPASNLNVAHTIYKPDNIEREEYEMYNWLRNHPENLQMQDADKGGYIVIISQQMAEDLAEAHTKTDAYELANLMISKFGNNSDYTGAGGKIWSTTANFIPEIAPQGKIKGSLDTDKNVADTLSLRLEYQLAVRMKDTFPDKILYDLLAWKPDEKTSPNDPPPIPKRKTNTGVELGAPDFEPRENFKRVLMSSVIKLHKKQVEDRNVCRSFCNETTAVSQLLRRLTQSLISQSLKKSGLQTPSL